MLLATVDSVKRYTDCPSWTVPVYSILCFEPTGGSSLILWSMHYAPFTTHKGWHSIGGLSSSASRSVASYSRGIGDVLFGDITSWLWRLEAGNLFRVSGLNRLAKIAQKSV